MLRDTKKEDFGLGNIFVQFLLKCIFELCVKLPLKYFVNYLKNVYSANKTLFF